MPTACHPNTKLAQFPSGRARLAASPSAQPARNGSIMHRGDRRESMSADLHAKRWICRPDSSANLDNWLAHVPPDGRPSLLLYFADGHHH